MSQKKSTKKGGTKGKAEGSKELRAQAREYARRAYSAALEHFRANRGNAFALSRLAVVYGEQRPGDFHAVITLPGSERDRAITDADLHKWLSRVEMLCRTLEHPDCTEAFRGAFGAVFTDNLLDGGDVTWTTPTVVRVMLPLALMDMVRRADGDPEQMLAIFETLREELNDEATAEEARASVVGV